MGENSIQQNRGTFSGRLGFILAAAGSAVGLGNIWRFPYLAAEYGGGIFLLVYLLLAVTFGFALMTVEILIGRKTGLSAIGAFKKLDKRFSFIGILASIVPVIILPYYCVIGGWVIKYFFTYASGGADNAAKSTFFGNFISNGIEPVGWFLIFLGITSIIVLLGVERGIEKVSKFMMPILVVMMLAVCIYTLFQPGALDGVVYYLKPDFSKFSAKTVLGAMGQLFYSMSLAMGIMITYGSYMKKDVSIEKSVRNIEVFDTGIAFLAGLMIIPCAFLSSGGNDVALQSGPGLMFVALPNTFNSMYGGTIVAIVFFILVFLAALTSSISLMETVVSIIKDKTGINRTVTCLIVFAISVILGIPSALGYGMWSGVTVIGMAFLDFFDFISNSVLMPIVALLTCIFVGYILKSNTTVVAPKLTHKNKFVKILCAVPNFVIWYVRFAVSPITPLMEEAECEGQCFKAKKLLSVVIRCVAPIIIVTILIVSILPVFTSFKI